MINPTISIRYGSLTDAPLLAELGAQAFIQAFGAKNTPENMTAYLQQAFSIEKQAQELAEPGSIFIIAESEGKPVGYARLLAGSTEPCITGLNPIELVRIYMVGDKTGQGGGSVIMRACLDEARTRGHEVIWLGVWEHNERAIRFYSRWGFEVVGHHSFQLGDDRQQDLIMQKSLLG